MHRRAVVAGLATLLAPGPAVGQERLSVVVLDQEALFTRSAFGRRVRAEIEAESETLARENRRIEAELEAEERALTEQRPDTDPTAFTELAAAFDARVEAIRSEQDAKARALQQRSERARAQFQAEAGPVLAELASEVGASVVLDRRLVLAAADQVDVTDRAVARIDAVLGDGTDPAVGPPSEPGE